MSDDKGSFRNRPDTTTMDGVGAEEKEEEHDARDVNAETKIAKPRTKLNFLSKGKDPPPLDGSTIHHQQQQLGGYQESIVSGQQSRRDSEYRYVQPGAVHVTGGIAPSGRETVAPQWNNNNNNNHTNIEEVANENNAGLVEAQPVEGGSQHLLELPQAEDLNLEDRARQSKEATRKFVRLLCAMIIVVALVGIIVGLLVRSSTDGSSRNEEQGLATDHKTNLSLAPLFPTMAPTLSLRDKLDFSLSNATMQTIQDDNLSPQGRAYAWLSKDPDLSDYVDQDWRVKQRFALASLYFSAKGGSWKDNTNWVGDYDIHECEWAAKQGWYIGGVYFDTSFEYKINYSNPCNADPNSSFEGGRYENIWLYANNLEGTLPPEFFWLTNLRSINLDSQTDDGDHSHDPAFGEIIVPHTITGTIATEFGKLSHLEVLAMAWSTFYGSLPTEIGLMTSLRILRLPNNFLSGSIPSEVGLLSHLVEIDLGSTGLTGSLPSELWQLTNLERLFLGASSDAGYNQFRGSIPSTIGLLTRVRDFAISGTSGGQIPTELFLLSHLEHLDISSDYFAGTIPTEIVHLSSLVSLNLAGSTLTGTLPSEIGIMQNLEELQMSASSITGSLPTEIGLASHLRVFNINSMNLLGPLPSEMGLCSRLVSLDSYESVFTGRIPSEIGYLSALTSLQLWNNRFSGTLPTELGLLLNAKEVWLSNNQLSGTIPESLTFLATEGSLSSLYLGSNEITGTLPFELVSLEELGCWDSLICGCSSDCPVPFQAYTDYLLEQSSSISRLEISDLSFNGTLSTSIGLLSNLETLILNRIEDLSGTIPSELGMLFNLKTLSIFNGELTGSLPSEIGLLESLEVLDIPWHRITGTIPVDLFDLTALSSLNLEGNNLTGSIAADVERLGVLTSFRLGINTLTGSVPSSMGLLRYLEELDLQETLLTGVIPSELGMLLSLRTLSLSRSPFTGTVPAELSTLAVVGALESLDITETALSGTIPPGLLTLDSDIRCGFPVCGCYAECPMAPDDYFDMLIVTDNIPENIWLDNFYFSSIPTVAGLLRNLKSLSLNGIMGGTIPTELGSLHQSLTSLSLAGSGLSGSIPAELYSLSKLEYLNLGDTPKLSGQIPSELGLLNFLTGLRFSASGVSGTLPSEIALLTDLEWLSLWNTKVTGTMPSELSWWGIGAESRTVELEGTQLSGTIPIGLLRVDPSCNEPLCGCYAACPLALNPYLTLLRDHDLDDSLEYLGLWNIYISSIPTEIGLLTNLKELKLKNIMGGTIPSELGLLQSLTSLGLSGSGLSGTFPSEAYNLPYLEDLDLDHAPLLVGQIPLDLVLSPRLSSLTFLNTSMTGIVPSERLDVLDHWYLDDQHYIGNNADDSEIDGR